MINPYQYSTLILEPALKYCGMYSLDAMYQMMRTAVVESQLTHLKQLPSGYALGFFQVEPETYHDVCRYLLRRTMLRDKILDYCQYSNLPLCVSALTHNLAFNALIARVKYWMEPLPIPAYNLIEMQASYWKTHYNSIHGAGKTQDFIKHATDVEGWINHNEGNTK